MNKHVAEPVYIAEPVFEEVFFERINQDQQWGGPVHDDRHTIQDFLMLIEARLGKAWQEAAPGGKAPRRRLLQVAALAVAAIERIDRIPGSDVGQSRQAIKAST